MSGTKPKTTMALDREHLRSMCGDDPEFEREIAGEFQRLADRLLVEIDECCRTGDLLKLFEAAHSLKGSSRSLGAAHLGDLCETLEQAGREGRRPNANEVERLRTEYARLATELEAISRGPGGPTAA